MTTKYIRKIIAYITVISIMVTLNACNKNEKNKVSNSDNLLASVQKSENSPDYNFNDTTQKPDEYDTYINKSTELAIKLLKLNNYDTENTVVAPLSVSLSLSALENGTSKDTLKEIKEFVGKSNYDTDIINKCSAYISQRVKFFNTADTGVFNISSVWISNNISPKRSFLQKYDNFYNIYFYKADFSKENTNNLITEFISDNSNSFLPINHIETKENYNLYLDCSTAISDTWLKSYSSDNVKTEKFNLNSSEKIDVTYITSVERTFESDNAQGFIKDFENIPCKLICIIPNDNISLKNYVNKLSYDKFLDMPNNISATKFSTVSIPEFSIKKNGSIKNILKEIGIETIFSENADFSKGFSENVFVDDITQSVSIDINKNGISTTKTDNSEIAEQSSESQLVFNKPFIYAVIDNEGYVPIIIGTVNNPQQ